MNLVYIGKTKPASPTPSAMTINEFEARAAKGLLAEALSGEGVKFEGLCGIKVVKMSRSPGRECATCGTPTSWHDIVVVTDPIKWTYHEKEDYHCLDCVCSFLYLIEEVVRKERTKLLEAVGHVRRTGKAKELNLKVDTYKRHDIGSRQHNMNDLLAGR